MDNREYKVITSNTPIFGSSAKMKRVLDEEAQTGWDFDEKFDNFKIRLSRDKSARENDAGATIDPYRTSVGVNSALYWIGATIITLIVIYLIIKIAAMTV